MKPLQRIDELLAMPVLVEKDKKELRRLSKRAGKDITRQRYGQLKRQPCLFDDDATELEKLARSLGLPVRLVRYDLYSDEITERTVG